jgi:sugar phosphate isomerase/epimerase
MSAADLRRVLGAVQDKDVPGDHLAFCRFARAAGFGWVELKYELRFDAGGRLTASAETVRDFAARHGLRLSVHAAYDDTNIGSPDERVQRASQAAYQRSLYYAARIGARFLTVHGGHLPPADRSADRLAALRRRTLTNLIALAAAARAMSVTLSVENRHAFGDEKIRYPVRPAEVLDCLAALGNGACCTIDSGHANSLRHEVSLVDFVRRVGPHRVALTHLHDNDGTADQHRIPGDGNVDFTTMMTAWTGEGWTFPLLFEVKGTDAFEEARRRVVALGILRPRAAAPARQ